MKKVLCIFIVLVISGCLQRREPMLHEKGEVVVMQYQPDTQQIVSGTGFSSSGNVVMTQHHIGEKEKFIVIFKCEHGVVFSINSNKLFAKLKAGDKVTIAYYEMINKNGEVKDFDFIDAYAD